MADTLFLDGHCAMCTKMGYFLSQRLSIPLEIKELEPPEGVIPDTMILIRNQKEYIRSAAAIRCLLYMKWNWKWLYPFAWLVPLPIRDLVYIVISKLRHSLSSPK
jgi:predicted DCC family thiol-disulfide oxidoreductase YuxK